MKKRILINAIALACISISPGFSEGTTDQTDLVSEQKAANEGDANAMLKLGDRYYDGKGVEKDQNEALRWYRKAAEAGNTEAMIELGDAFVHGDGLTKDLKEGVRWYRKAADDGNINAMYKVAVACFGDGDFSQAAKWFRKSAEGGNTDSMRKIGLLYLKGQGLTKDATEAVRWFRRAADEGNVKAMINLADQYTDGEGIGKDLGEAAKWYRKAAEHGSSSGMVHLGLCYENGDGVEKNPSEAVRWMSRVVSLYEKSIDLDNRDAVVEVSDNQLDIAIDSLRRAAAAGHEQAVAFLKSVKEREAEQKKKLQAREKKLKEEGGEIWDHAIVLSDGRHVVVEEKTGEFYSIGTKLGDPEVKLTGDDKAEAERLFRKRQNGNR